MNRVIASFIAAFAVTALGGRLLIPWLRALKAGQTIKEIGPSWHKSKQGTPTMGGIMFIAAIAVAAVGLIVHFAVNQKDEDKDAPINV